jgi:hypothetical protein
MIPDAPSSWFKPEGIKQLEETFAANSAAEFKLKVYPSKFCHLCT